ncbi:MAG: hypothetical protein Q4B58_03670 [Bacteroidales bacterium]|nr:hypothetical protein [Bacteroidales bacterium]
MRKILVMLFALFVSANVFAFEFDGINLNDKTLKVTREVGKKGYVTDPANPNRFKGNCRGKEIYISFDLDNVSEENHVGALLVDVPMAHPEAYETSVELLNVIYHQDSATEAGTKYVVDKDGTIMLLSKTQEGIRLTYYTSYFEQKKSKK